jgi:CRP/FNR family cyclic AMP-dependent transcriptional regulator
MKNPPSTLAAGLSGVSPALQDLAARGVLKSYAAGRRLIDEGDDGDTLFIIMSGRLRAFSEDAANGTEITYGTYGPGQYVGEMNLDGGQRAANVETLERSTCAVVTRRTVEAFMAERPEFALELLVKLIRRARAATAIARQMALNDVYGRLRLLLEGLAVTGDDGRRVVVERLTHKEMAQRLGCTRSMVTRRLKDLERGGYVACGPDRRLVLLRHLPSGW